MGSTGQGGSFPCRQAQQQTLFDDSQRVEVESLGSSPQLPLQRLQGQLMLTACSLSVWGNASVT